MSFRHVFNESFPTLFMYQNVCLVSPPWINRSRSIWQNVEGKNIPFGLGYLAAILERDSHAQVSIIDAKAEDLTVQQTVHRISQKSPDLIGITSCTYDYNDGIALAQILKEKIAGVPICFGGIHASVLPGYTLNHSCIDFVVRGEGEYTFLELVQGKSPQEIRGLSYKKKGEVVHNSHRPVIKNLDELPQLSYHLLPMDKYYPTAGQCRRLPAVAMVSSRGCPGKCIFCCSSLTGHRVRRFSPQRILDEISFLVEHYGMKEVVFMDDTMTFPREEMVRLCNLLKQKKYEVIWDCSTRVNFVDQPLLELMKDAGCNQISFGIESGDDAVLHSIKKGHTIVQVKKAVQLAKKAGLEVRGSFILGFPADCEETMNRTIEISHELELDLASFYIATPYPGTEMFEWAEKNGRLLTKNWSFYDQSHLIMDIPCASHNIVEKLYQKAWRSFYWRPSYLLKRFTKLRSIHDVTSALRAFKGVIAVSGQ